MRPAFVALSVFAILTVCFFGDLPKSRAQEVAPAVFLRGDANSDGRITLADVFRILHYLHRGVDLGCPDAADVDDSGEVTTVDFLFLIGFLFLRETVNHGPPPPPYPAPGYDPTPDPLGCTSGPAGGGAGAGDGRKGGAREAGAEGENPGGGGGFGEGDTGRPPPCVDQGAGVDLEFLRFLQRELHVAPGQEHVRVPIVLRSIFGGLEGLTISVYAPPDQVRLEGLDIRGTILDANRTRATWWHTYRGARDLGFLSLTYAVDLESGTQTLPAFYDRVAAHLSFSLQPSVAPGSSVELVFTTVPGNRGFPPLPTELVRAGEPVPFGRCSLIVKVVDPDESFTRGDADLNRRIDIGDVAAILLHLFTGRTETVRCADAADTDDDGRVTVTDAVRLAQFIFLYGPPPPEPFPGLGTDPTADPLTCGGGD